MGNRICGNHKDVSIKSNRPMRKKSTDWKVSDANVSCKIGGTLYSTTLNNTDNNELFEGIKEDENETIGRKEIKGEEHFDEVAWRQHRLENIRRYILERDKEESILCKAINEDSFDAYKRIKDLIEAGEDVNARYRNGDPLLYNVLCNGQYDVFKLLLSYGADVNCRNKEWDPIIYTALQSDKTDLLQAAIDYGSEVDCRNSKGDPILYSAILSRQKKMIEILLEHGADPNLRNNLGTSCLEEAMTSKQIDIMEMLVEAGADLDIKDKEGNSLLHVALMFKQIECVAKLLALGMDVNITDKEGNPALELAILMQDIPAITILLSYGCDVNLKNKKGIPVFFKAVGQTGISIIQILINNGVDLNCQDSSGNTVIFRAVEKNNVDVIRLVLDCGIDANIRNSEGQNCLEYASNFKSDRRLAVCAIIESCTVMPIHRNGILDISGQQNMLKKMKSDNFVSFCDRALFMTSKQSCKHIRQWINCSAPSKYWFSKVNIFCDHVHIDCLIDGRLQRAYTTLKDITKRQTSRKKYKYSTDADVIEDQHPFEADEPHAITEFELLLTIINKIKDGLPVNKTSENGNSLLHLAVKYKQIGSLRFLLKNGGNPYKNNNQSCSALKMALKTNERLAAFLICQRIIKDYIIAKDVDISKVWMGFKCHCKGHSRPEREICSDESVLVDESDDFNFLSTYFFKGVRVFSMRNSNSFASDMNELDNIQEFISGDPPFKLQNSTNLPSYKWKTLFEHHRNLKFVCPAFVRSFNFDNPTVDHEIQNEQCIRLICKFKGVIPIDEVHFPDRICGTHADCVKDNNLIAVLSRKERKYQLDSLARTYSERVNVSNKIVEIKYDYRQSGEIESCPKEDQGMLGRKIIVNRGIITFPIDIL